MPPGPDPQEDSVEVGGIAAQSSEAKWEVLLNLELY